MAAPISMQNRRADLSQDRFYSNFKQDPHTTQLRPEASEGIEALVKNVQKVADDSMKLVIATLEKPDVSAIDGGGSKHDNTGPVIAALQAASAQAASAKVTAETAKMQQESARFGLAQMIGKNVKVANTRFFSGKEGTSTSFQYNIGKNLPSDARITGTITVLDANKRRIYSEKIRNMKPGENTFKWLGFDDMERPAKPGQYSIKIEATYTTPNNQNPLPVQVNTMTESKIAEVNINEGKVTLENGSRFNIKDIAAITTPEQNEGRKTSAEEVSKAANYLGKNIVIKEDNVEFTGSSVKLGFNSSIDTTEAQVKIIARRGNETKSLEIKEMPISKGRNEVLWQGNSTITQADLDAKSSGKKFPKVPNGDYEYDVYVSEGEGYPWRKMNAMSTVAVVATESIDGKTRLVLEDGTSVPEESFHGFAANSPSSQDLVSRAAEFVGKKVEVPRIIEYDGSGVLKRSFEIPSYAEGMDTALSIDMFDEEGKTLSSTQVSESDITKLLEQQLIFNNLDDKSKAKLYAHIEDRRDNHHEFWEFNGKDISYANIDDINPGADGTTNKQKIDQHIYEQVRLGLGKEDGYHLKEGFTPQYALEVDKGLGPAGTLTYEYSYTVSNTTGERKEYFFGKYPASIASTYVQDDKVFGTLDGDGREIEISPETKFVA